MRTVIITGVTRGLGKAIFKLLVPTFSTIVCIGRALPEIECGLTGKVKFIKHDLSKISIDFSKIDESINGDTKEMVFINNAGTIIPICRIGELQWSDILTSVAVNFTCPLTITNILVSIAKERAIPLQILNISTGAAKHPIAGWSLYCSTKAATRMFYDCLSLENDDIFVTHIDPGVIDTGMQETIRNASREQFPKKDQFMALKSDGKLKSPEEVGRQILTDNGLL
jgi:short-subunit dehydrogenase